MSIFKTLLLMRDPADDSYSVRWLDEVPLVSRLSEADRGMELSELMYFHDKLLSFSDRTGVIYQIADLKLVPLWILSDYDGNSEDGFKSEWATVKDGEVVVVGGSICFDVLCFLQTYCTWVQLASHGRVRRAGRWSTRTGSG